MTSTERVTTVNKLLIAAAGVAGYVLGTKAGRERYDQIRTQSQKVWNSPTVQSGVDHAADAAKSAASAAGSAAADAASQAASAAASKVSEAVHRSSDDEDALRAEADTEVPTAVSSPPTAADLAEPRTRLP